jgi:hypothetical protein
MQMLKGKNIYRVLVGHSVEHEVGMPRKVGHHARFGDVLRKSQIQDALPLGWHNRVGKWDKLFFSVATTDGLGCVASMSSVVATEAVSAAAFAVPIFFAAHAHAGSGGTPFGQGPSPCKDSLPSEGPRLILLRHHLWPWRRT